MKTELTAEIGRKVRLADGRIGEIIDVSEKQDEHDLSGERAYPVKIYGEQERDPHQMFSENEFEVITEREFELLKQQR